MNNLRDPNFVRITNKELANEFIEKSFPKGVLINAQY